MKRFLICAASGISLGVMVVFAQAQQQVQEETYNFKLTKSQLDVISEGLQTQPFGKVVSVFNALREQYMEQIQKKDVDNCEKQADGKCKPSPAPLDK